MYDDNYDVIFIGNNMKLVYHILTSWVTVWQRESVWHTQVHITVKRISPFYYKNADPPPLPTTQRGPLDQTTVECGITQYLYCLLQPLTYYLLSILLFTILLLTT